MVQEARTTKHVKKTPVSSPKALDEEKEVIDQDAKDHADLTEKPQGSIDGSSDPKSFKPTGATPSNQKSVFGYSYPTAKPGSVDSAERRMSPADVNLLDVIEMWKKGRLKGGWLLQSFRELISPDDIDLAHILNVKMLMDYLTDHDVSIAKNGKTHIKDILKLKLGYEIPTYYDRALSSAPNRSREQHHYSDAPQKYFDSSRAAEKIDKKFSQDDAKYGGSIEESIEHFLQEYNIACEKYCIPREFHVKCALFKGVAKTFFLANILRKTDDPDQAFYMLREECKTLDRHARLSELYSNLKRSDVKTDDLTRAEALDLMTKKLSSWKQQLGEPCMHPILYKDRIIQAVSGEKFSSVLSIDPPLNPNQAMQRLHLGISNLEKLEKAENAELKEKIEKFDRAHQSRRSKHFKESKERKLNVDKTGKKGYNPISRHPGLLLLRHKCGSGDHFLPDCDKTPDEVKVHIAHDIAKQFHGLGIFYAKDLNDSDDSYASSSDSSSDERNDDTTAINYARTVEKELTERSNLHGVMGSNEIFYARNSSKFRGILCDPGAQVSTAAKAQYYARLKHVRAPKIDLKPIDMWVKGINGARIKAYGSAQMRFPIDDIGHMCDFDCMIVDSDAPIMLCGNEFKRAGFHLQGDVNKLVCPKDEWSIPLEYTNGHYYIQIPEHEILYTESEAQEIMFSRKDLEVLHKKFGHPQADKLHNVMKKAGEDVSNEDLKVLKKIGRECFPCQRFAKNPMRYMATVPEEIQFNHELVMGIMHIESKPVLHIICAGTRFNVAVFLTDASAETVWATFNQVWLSPCVGTPHIIRVDQGKQFASDEFKADCRSLGIFLKDIPVESPNSMGIGERYHGPLRRTYLKIAESIPQISRNLILSYSHKALNDTMGPEGFVPTLLVYGMLPRLPIGAHIEATPNQSDRMKALSIARSEMEQIVAGQRLKTARDHQLPTTLLDTEVSPGMLVLAYRKNSECWEGPYELVQVEGKVAYVKTSENYVQPFSVARVKPLLVSPDEAIAHEDLENISEQDAQVFLNKALTPSDIDEEIAQQFDPAIKTEMNGLFANGAFKKAPKSQAPKGANILRSKLALSYKDIGTPKERKKARLVALGRLDKQKDYMASDSPTLMRYALRIILALASCQDLKVYSRDVKQAYLQAGTPFQRELYMVPPKGCEDDDEEEYALQILKPLHGIVEPGTYWLDAYMHFFENDMEMESFALDPCFAYRKSKDRIDGMVGVIVDDTIGAGTSSFLKDEDKNHKKFLTTPKETSAFDFSGMHVAQKANVITLDQKRCTSTVDKISSLDPDKKVFQSGVGKLSWAAHSTRPDLSFFVAKLSQARSREIHANDMRLLKKAINLLHKKKVALKLPKLDLSTSKLAVYSDASFAANDDHASQLGYVVILVDAAKKCSALHWNSYKSKRSIRSALGAEFYAFCDAMGITTAFQIALRPVVSRILPAHMHADSKSLLDTITQRSQTREKRLLIDLAMARDAYKKKEIDNVGWVRSENNLADPLTKSIKDSILDKVLETNILEHRAEQRIAR